MYTGPRDPNIDVITTRPGTYASGMGLGIMLIDDEYPAWPGDWRNPSGYPFPIQYDVVDGVDIHQLLFADDKSAFLEPIIQSARRLERMGCKAIAAECGGFAVFQKEVAAAVSIPVFMSSLVQVPLAQQVIGSGRQVGIVCLFKDGLTDLSLTSSGIDPESDIVIMGARDDYSCPEFANLWDVTTRPEIPTASFARADADFVSACKDFVAKNPRLGALVFLCTGFQPFARAVQREVGLPIFSCSTVLDYAFSIAAHREHYGHV